MDALYDKLDYRFRDPALLQRALRHRSAGRDNNERMEFLGDAVLGMIVSQLLFQVYPAASEGDLSRLRAVLVQQATLADIARELELGSCLRLGSGELKSGGANRDSILADAFEALVSALYLDAGLELCAARVHTWFLPRLQPDTLQPGLKDAKTYLQEYMQARKLPLPAYTIVEIEGKEHVQRFHVHCKVVLLSQPEPGSGGNRKEAEQQAAQAVLTKLGVNNG